MPRDVERVGMIDTRVVLHSGKASKHVSLTDYLDSAAEESAHEDAYAWIKSLRAVMVDGTTLRDRFTIRSDSLWWFTELSLHKTQVVVDVHRTLRAAARLADAEAPHSIEVLGSPITAHILAAFAAARGIRCPTSVSAIVWLKRLARLDARARALNLAGRATRERWRSSTPPSNPSVAAFVHRAFWRSGEVRASAETYIGPILQELEARLGGEAVQYVGVGPATNFRVHRALRSRATAAVVVPVERFAPRRMLNDSRVQWNRRYAAFKALTQAAEIHDRASIQGVDCWPIVREQLAGIAWLQWPWSARAMDEAAAALDALRPRVVVTYAEAGGWGRALLLESRRRGIPSAGLQHGFIYHRWLNYRHEPDEMTPTATAPFPLPTRTLLFDEYAARHLVTNGRFPEGAVQVTGSPRLDALINDLEAIDTARVRQLREQLRIGPSDVIGLVATKEREAHPALETFLDAAGRVKSATIVIKPHPAESAGVYSTYLQGRPHVRVADDGIALALLLAAARAVITVNSTVALDAGAVGIPALSIGLPNNLSPFVDAGAMAGTLDAAALPGLIERILYDESFRQQLAERRRETLGDPGPPGPRRAAIRSAEAVMELIGERPA